MKSSRLILALVASFALVAGMSFAADTPAPAPQKSACCQQAEKDGKKPMECCVAAAKEGKACEKCAPKPEKKEEKK